MNPLDIEMMNMIKRSLGQLYHGSMAVNGAMANFFNKIMEIDKKIVLAKLQVEKEKITKKETNSIAKDKKQEIKKLTETEKQLKKKQSINNSINQRLGHFNFSKMMIFKSFKSFFFGYGIGSYGKLYNNSDEKLYPHNFFLEVMFEMGVVGVILSLFFFSYIIYILYSNHSNLIIYFMLTYIALNAMKSGPIINQRIFFSIIAISLIINKKN